MAPKFQIFTGLLKAYEGQDGKGFRTIASSTISDHAKDEIQVSAIEQMAQKAKGNLTVFLNHEYRVPEDVLGSVTDTHMQTRGVDSEGNPIVDLEFDVRLNESNPRALQTFDAIKSGVKLGTSIGAIVRAAEKKKGGGLRISDVELLEASIVGIPANPRSWVQYAMKSINALPEEEVKGIVVLDEELEEVIDAIAADAIAVEPELEKAMCKQCQHAMNCDCTDCSCDNVLHRDLEPDLVKESHPELPDSAFACIDSKGRHYPHHTKSGALDKGLLRNALSRLGDKSNTQCGAGHIRAHARSAGIGESSDKGWTLPLDEEEFGLKEFIPTEELVLIDKTIADDPDHFGPEKEAARTRVTVTVDSDSAQDAPSKSSPESALMDEDRADSTVDGDTNEMGDAVTYSDEPETTKDETPSEPADTEAALSRFFQTADFAAVITKLQEVTKELVAKDEALRKTTAERDEATENFAVAKEIIDRIADLPVGRKTQFSGAVTDFRKRFPQYDDEFMKFLEK